MKIPRPLFLLAMKEKNTGKTSFYQLYRCIAQNARVAESVDARDLKSLDRKVVPVQVRPRAPFIKQYLLGVWLLFSSSCLHVYCAGCYCPVIALFSITITPTERNNMSYNDEIIVRDSNGNILKDGDSVTLIKDLPVKGANVTLKRGTLIKNIRLTHDEENIECNAEKVKGLVLKTCFLKKA